MPKFGIVQGRLTPSTELQSFPEDWKREFYKCPDIGMNYIELIAEREHNESNPIWSDAVGLSRMLDVFSTNTIICNDYIINHSLDDWRQTGALIDSAKRIGCEMIVLPLFEASAKVPRGILNDIDLEATTKDITIALETTENYYPFPLVYDTGNRVIEGINLAREIKELGSKIVHVHIKDKNEKGENCLLGTGLVNFQEVMQAFKDIGYDGTYTFETVRGKDPIRTAKYNLEFIKFFMAEAS